MAFTAVVGTRVIPCLLDHVADTRSRELFTLTVLVLALGIAVGSALIFSVSMALGAFLAGMVVGRSDYSLRAASDALPMRDAFAVLFFVSVGMLLDPLALLLATAAPARRRAGGRSWSASRCVALTWCWRVRYPLRVALSVAAALAQIGEFSFILATLGRELGVLTMAATNVLVAASIVSIVVNPLAYRAIRPRRALGVAAAAAVAGAQPRGTGVGPRACAGPDHRRAAPGGGGGIRPDGPHGGAPAPGQRRRADGDRVEHGHGACACGNKDAPRCTATRPIGTR